MEPLVVERFTGDVAGQGVLCLRGPLTAENLVPFQKALRDENSATVILDLTDVPYIDSAGLGSLVTAYVSRHKAGRRMALSGVNGRVLNLFEITRVEPLLLIFPTLEEAVEALAHAARA
jgi:anti-sigma B factor antagonist